MPYLLLNDRPATDDREIRATIRVLIGKLIELGLDERQVRQMILNDLDEATYALRDYRETT